jgi:uncharacterized protein
VVRRLVSLFAVVAALVVASPSAASAQQFAFCAAAQEPRFDSGFADLRARVGPTMGQPTECEHADGGTGDTLQETTTGLAFYRKSTNTATFTDGWRHWGLTPAGLVYWEGESIDPTAVAVVVPSVGPSRLSASPARLSSPSTLERFVRGVQPRIDQFWAGALAGAGARYTTPRVIWVEEYEVVQTGCGSGVVLGPLYCRLDETMVLPGPFFQSFWQQEDAAVVVVIAHEWGHHVQRLLGTLGSGLPTVQLELQADCYAGAFFNYAQAQNWLDPGDVDEAARMAFRSGDRVERPWNDRRAHGSPQQRERAFRDGFEGPSSCASYLR